MMFKERGGCAGGKEGGRSEMKMESLGFSAAVKPRLRRALLAEIPRSENQGTEARNLGTPGEVKEEAGGEPAMKQQPEGPGATRHAWGCGHEERE